MKKVNIAVVGAGGLAQSQHIPNLVRAENAELKVICDLRAEVLDQLSKEYPGPEMSMDFNEVLTDESIDAVVIATRDDHVPLTLEALGHNKHVYVEKPLAETGEECRKVIELQRKMNKLVAVGMNRRLAPAYQYTRNLLKRNGGPKNMFYRIADSYCLDWGKDFGEGMRIVHELCHIFDILRFFTESEVKSVYCISSRNDDEQVTVKFENGCVASILSSGYVESDMPKEHFEAVAKVGSIVVDDFVEARCYSMPDESPVKRFAGHFHPHHDIWHAPLLESMGLDALHSIRRESLAVKKRFEKLSGKRALKTREYDDLEALVERTPLRNYLVNKGWLQALEHFSDRILNGGELQTASAADALEAARITEAAIESRNTGNLVHLR